MSAAAVRTTAAAVGATAAPPAVEATATAMEATAYGATTAAPAATTAAPTATVSALATTISATVSAPAPSPPTVAVPGASAEEHAAVEPLRTIVAVGRTTVGRVSVVAVLTYGRGVRVTAADVDSKRDLRVSGGCRHQDESKDRKQCEILETTHRGTPCWPARTPHGLSDAGHWIWTLTSRPFPIL